MNEDDEKFLEEVRKGRYGHEKVMRVLDIVSSLKAEVSDYHKMACLVADERDRLKADIGDLKKSRDSALADAASWKKCFEKAVDDGAKEMERADTALLQSERAKVWEEAAKMCKEQGDHDAKDSLDDHAFARQGSLNRMAEEFRARAREEK